MRTGFSITDLPGLVDRCRSMADLRRIHARITTVGLAGDDFIISKLLLFSAISDFGDLSYSYRIFATLPSPPTFAYNTMIRGFSQSRNPNRALSLYVLMLRRRAQPDHLTFPFLAKSCARLVSLNLGAAVHCNVTKTGHQPDLFIFSSLIHMYASCAQMPAALKVFGEIPLPNLVSRNALLDGLAKCGDLPAARQAFDEMPERDVVSWSAMIDGYVKGGDYESALALFDRMLIVGPKANEVTMVSLLCACAHSGSLEKGKRMRRYIEDNAVTLTLAVATSLVDMYAKCGSIGEAVEVFRSFPEGKTDVLFWNAMICGFAMQGMTTESIDLFAEMAGAGIKPDEITYLGLLSACAHGGFVGEARELFRSMRASGMAVRMEHYACMVDVLGRAGFMEEAIEVVRAMPMEPSAALLGALLSACQSHGWAEVGETVGRALVELDPGHDGRYVGLSNVLAVSQRWGEAKTMREEMERRGVRKAPGMSQIEVGGTLHTFTAHDNIHPQSIQLYSMLTYVTNQMKIVQILS